MLCLLGLSGRDLLCGHPLEYFLGSFSYFPFLSFPLPLTQLLRFYSVETRPLLMWSRSQRNIRGHITRFEELPAPSLADLPPRVPRHRLTSSPRSVSLHRERHRAAGALPGFCTSVVLQHSEPCSAPLLGRGGKRGLKSWVLAAIGKW